MGDNRAEESLKEKSRPSNHLFKSGRYIFPEIKNCIMSQWRKLMDMKDVKMDTNLLWLVLYWIIVIVAFITVAFYKNSKLLPLTTIWMILLYFVCTILVTHIFSYKKRVVMYLSTIIPSVIFFIIVKLTGLIYYRPYICAFLATCFSILFTLILYGEEKMSIKSPLEFIHRRYLEYLRSFIWIIIFGSFGYYTWQLESKKNQVEMAYASGDITTKVAAMSYPDKYPLSTSLLQIGVVIFFGVAIVIYAFHTKLREIEDKESKRNE